MLEKIKHNKKWRITLIILGTLITLLILLYSSIYFGLFGKIPTKTELKNLKQSEATQVLSSNGELIGKYYVFDRQPIVYKDLPQHLIDALIATEDARFFSHDGIDGKSVLRVFFKTILLRDKSSGGGSTITLQLAKNLYGRKDYGIFGILVNKIQESIIARRLEDIYNKKEILTLYFNTVPFSDNTFGIESASRKFFDKSTKDLSLVEAAVLVGTLKASHSYNPRIFPERSRLRRDVVLTQMGKYGYLSPSRVEEAKLSDMVINYQFYSHDQGIAAYFREHLRQDLQGILDTIKNKDGNKYNIYKDGLIIHTTLDAKMQEFAEAAVNEHLKELQEVHEKSYGKNGPWSKNQAILLDALKRTTAYKKLDKKGMSNKEIINALNKNKREMELFNFGEEKIVNASSVDSTLHYLKLLNAGFLALEPSGAVKAWVGGVDFEYFKYDHVAQSKRQVGSTFKPFVYTAALENGMEPCTYFTATEITYEGGWTPSNSGSVDEDPFLNYNLKTALSNSINTIAVKVLMETGVNKVVDQAYKMGIESKLPNYPSIALGTPELSLKELASAYTTFINNGKANTPYYITKIEDGNGNVLATFKPKITSKPAISNNTRQIMIEMMKGTVDEGTAQRLRFKYNLNNDIAGKTGTTQSNKDGWFVGITPKLATVTWVGTDDHRIGFRNTGIGQGANSALPIFALFLQKLNANKDYKEYTQAKFESPSAHVQQLMDCEATKEDGFFKRLFGDEAKKANRERRQKKDKKEKKGFFKRIFSNKDKNN